jgi:hypothetical protein
VTGKSREVSPLLLVVTLLFVLYLVLPWLQLVLRF